MKNFVQWLVLGLALGAALACGSDSLTEESAGRLVAEQVPIVYGLEIPKLMTDVGDSHRAAVNRLRKQGLVSYEYPKGGEAGIVLAQDGLIFLREEQLESYVVSGWREKVVEVSGFRLQDDGTAVAEVVIELTDVTPFAAAFSNKDLDTRYSTQVRISRRKSGDGWRVSRPKSPLLKRLGNKGVEDLPTWSPDPA